jgi:hypothetical protein
VILKNCCPTQATKCYASFTRTRLGHRYCRISHITRCLPTPLLRVVPLFRYPTATIRAEDADLSDSVSTASAGSSAHAVSAAAGSEPDARPAASFRHGKPNCARICDAPAAGPDAPAALAHDSAPDGADEWVQRAVPDAERHASSESGTTCDWRPLYEHAGRRILSTLSHSSRLGVRFLRRDILGFINLDACTNTLTVDLLSIIQLIYASAQIQTHKRR